MLRKSRDKRLSSFRRIMARKTKANRAAERPAPRRPTRQRRPAPPKRGAGLVERALRWVLLWVLRILWRIAWRVGAVTALVLAGAVAYYTATLPPVDQLLDGRDRGSVTLLDKDGNVFAWRGDQFGGQLRSTEVSPHLKNAVIATEDRRFYHHFGVDPLGILRALYINLRAGRMVQGGSTLTQQTAKVVFLENERSWERKLREVPLALAMELKYAKDDILSIYMNRVYLGAGTYGFEAAAQRYFGKSAREVNPAEAAMLAGLLKAPSRYAPTSDLAAAQGRAAVIIGLMHDQGFLTDAQAQAALDRPAELSQAAAQRAGGYFADWVMESGPAFLTRSTAEDVEIATTFDPAIQKAAEAALAKVFETKVRKGSEAQAAIVVLSADGAVRAMVGGREITPQAGQFNRATQALRQTGSVFKPVVYAAALAAGMMPNDIVEDAPISIEVPGSGTWTPRNYGRTYRGPITLTEALAHSVNTAAVRVSEQVGRDKVVEMARKLGMSGPFAPGPAIALGTTEAPLIDMAGVYACFLNGGMRVTPYGVRRIRLRGEKGELLGSDRAEPVRVLTPRQAALLTGMLREVVVSGTGRRAALADREIAGKTGTTSAARDAWFIGFSAQYVVAVWMGYDDNRPLSHVTGGGLPAEIFRETMQRIHEGLPALPLPAETPPPGEGTLIAAAPTLADPDADPLSLGIFRDVLRGLGLEATDPDRRARRERERAGADR
ncbi:MAG: PBP1A family penicillin-binding protein [Alphaproteobacteria bacterium]|nr:MAG: PBP1A family penicillin-binding protein [Alphaproteobacteria bacterium]